MGVFIVPANRDPQPLPRNSLKKLTSVCSPLQHILYAAFCHTGSWPYTFLAHVSFCKTPCPEPEKYLWPNSITCVYPLSTLSFLTRTYCMYNRRPDNGYCSCICYCIDGNDGDCRFSAKFVCTTIAKRRIRYIIILFTQFLINFNDNKILFMKIQFCIAYTHTRTHDLSTILHSTYLLLSNIGPNEI